MRDGAAVHDDPLHEASSAFGSEWGIRMRGDGTSIGKSIVKCLHICHDERMTKIIAPGPQLVARILRIIQRTSDKQGNVTMLRLAENIANDAALVRLSQAEGWDAAVQEAEDRGLLNDVFADEIRGRNPYREETPDA